MEKPKYPYVRFQLCPGLHISHNEKGERIEEVKPSVSDLRIRGTDSDIQNVRQLIEEYSAIPLEHGNFPTNANGETLEVFRKVESLISTFTKHGDAVKAYNASITPGKSAK